MKKIGIRAYRFSIDWSRVIPDGTGTVNQKGLAFYADRIDTLLENNIEPYLTLYHWELPEDNNWTWNVSWWSDPVILGAYPEEGIRRFYHELPKIS